MASYRGFIAQTFEGKHLATDDYDSVLLFKSVEDLRSELGEGWKPLRLVTARVSRKRRKPNNKETKP